MRCIYRNSVKTLIWLGHDWAASVAAWRLLDRIYNVFREQNLAAVDPSNIPILTFSQSAHDSSGSPAWDDDAWAHLRRVIELRWFSRIWVVQEVALSRQDPVILHGANRYPWSRFGWAVAWLRRNGYMRLPQIPEQLRNVDTMASIHRARTPWPLDALMSITQVKFHASDQRDKVYGLGLAAECQDASNVPDELRPDYSVKVTDLYQKVAYLLLRLGGSPAVLTRARGVMGSATRRQREYDLDLASWCPDWSDFKVFNEGISTSLSWIHYGDMSKPARLGFPNHYATSSGLDLQLEPQHDTSSLQLRGSRLTRVSRVVSFDIKALGDVESDRHFDVQMARILDEALSLLPGNIWLSWAEKFINATTAEQHYLVGRGWDQSLRDGLAYLHKLLADDAVTVSLSALQMDRKKVMSLLRESSAGGIARNYESYAISGLKGLY